MYLVAPREPLSDDLVTHLKRPFVPFDQELWLMVVLFTLFVSIITMIVDGEALVEQDVHLVARYCLATYITWHSLFSGGPQNTPRSFPARLSQLGFGFFVIISITTYTANLATILVRYGYVQKEPSCHARQRCLRPAIHM
jgi:hypothetical protein